MKTRIIYHTFLAFFPYIITHSIGTKSDAWWVDPLWIINGMIQGIVIGYVICKK